MKAGLVAIGLVIVGLAFWLLSGDLDEGTALPIEADRPEASSETTLPAGQGELSAPAKIDVSAAPPAARADAPVDAAREPMDPSLARVDLLVVSANTGEPLAGVELIAPSLLGDVTIGVGPTATGPDPQRATSDASGRASFSVLAGVPLECGAFRRSDGAYTSHALDPLSPGETAAVRLELPTEPDAQLVGRVVVDETDEPVADARVRLFPRRPELGVEVVELRTDAQGRFETPFASWTRRHGRVDAPGFGPRSFSLANPHDTWDRALVVRLHRGATLRGQIRVLGSGAGADGGARLVVHADAKAYEFAQGTGVSFPSQADEHRRAPVAADGSWAMTDLPPGAGLDVTLMQGGSRRLSEPDPLYLLPGEERTLEWTLGGGARVLGRVVLAETGAPVPGLDVWRVHARDVRGLIPGHITPEARTESDDEGRFAFDDVPAGDWAIGPAPPKWIDDITDDVITPLPVTLPIAEGDELVEIELRVHRGLFIDGQVVGPEGEPIHESRVAGFSEDAGTYAMAYSDAGDFRLGPLVPGAYRVQADGGAEHTSSSESVVAMAGDAGVVLRLRAGGSLAGRLVVASTGEALQGRIQVASEQDGGWYSTRTRADGSFSFAGLALGRYTIHGSTDTLAGSLAGVLIAHESPATDLEVLLRPAAILLVRHTGEQPGLMCEVVSHTENTTNAQLEPGKTFRSVWEPGPVVVTVEGPDSKRERTIELLAGEETRVEFGDG